ncbi:hypothetical protein DE146DRAFT_240413 [Phaeosphaeria sp. MPI-PUGE-AT-0046c]|nr:hypothetical protein DE146DRAFT_240413 [Phaeosphaeria sp. MPI-PUGE-AT-0046c]
MQSTLLLAGARAKAVPKVGALQPLFATLVLLPALPFVDCTDSTLIRSQKLGRKRGHDRFSMTCDAKRCNDAHFPIARLPTMNWLCSVSIPRGGNLHGAQALSHATLQKHRPLLLRCARSRKAHGLESIGVHRHLQSQIHGAARFRTADMRVVSPPTDSETQGKLTRRRPLPLR